MPDFISMLARTRYFRHVVLLHNNASACRTGHNTASKQLHNFIFIFMKQQASDVKEIVG